MRSLFNLIKQESSREHHIVYDVLQGFDEYDEEEDPQEQNQPEVVSYDLEALNLRKQKLLEEIQELEERAQSILRQTEEKAKELRHEAGQRGYEEGYAKGFSAGSDEGFETALQDGVRNIRQENQEVLDELKRMIERVDAKKQEILKKYQEDLKDIAIAVAEKVVHISLKSSGDVIKRMILAAMEGMQKTEWAKIYIAKTDSQVLLQGETNLINEISHISEHIKIIVMEEEASGTCIIEMPDKILDASANTQLANIREILSSGRM